MITTGPALAGSDMSDPKLPKAPLLFQRKSRAKKIKKIIKSFVKRKRTEKL